MSTSWGWKGTGDNNIVRKTEDGQQPEFGTGSGITSINGDSTAAQSIVGGSNVNVSSVGGTTTITATGAAAGTVTGMTAPQMFTSPVNETGLGVLELQYNGTPMALSAAADSLLESTQTNTSTGVSAEAGFAGVNDSGDKMEVVMSGSGNTQRGIIRSASTALGMDINQLGTGKTLRLMTNNSARATINDSGLDGVIGATTPAAGAFTTVTASTPIAVTSGGTGNAVLTDHNVLIGQGTGAVAVVAPSTAGFVLTSNGASADPSFQINTPSGINQVVFQGTSTSTQSISTATVTQVTGWTSSIDTATGFASNTYTVPYTGYYKVEAQVVFADAVGEYNGTLLVYRNGSLDVTGYIQHAAISQQVTLFATGVMNCAATDTITIRVEQDSGSSLALLGTAANTTWIMTSVGGANTGGGGSGTVTNVATTSTAGSLTLTGGPITTSGTVAVNYSGTPWPTTEGGTGLSTVGTNGQVLTSNGSVLSYATPATPTTTTNVWSGAYNLFENYVQVGGTTITQALALGLNIVVNSSTLHVGGVAYGSDSVRYVGYRSEGTEASPTVVGAGSVLIGIQGSAYDGSSWNINSPSAAIFITANTLQSVTNHDSKITLQTTPTGSTTRGDAFIINQDKSITILGPINLGAATPGSSGQVLQSNGSSSLPTWVSQLNILGLNNTWTGTNTFQNTVTVANNAALTINSGSTSTFNGTTVISGPTFETSGTGTVTFNNTPNNVTKVTFNTPPAFTRGATFTGSSVGVNYHNQSVGIGNDAGTLPCILNIKDQSSIFVSTGGVIQFGNINGSGKLLDSTGSAGTAGQFLVSQGIIILFIFNNLKIG